MSFRKLISLIVGVFQEVVGVGALVFAYFFYYDIFNFHGILYLSSEYIPILLFLLFVFGLLSIISGGLLIHEWQELP
ncbi:MAG: hypothetical protein ACOC6G_03650 [Thermoproteota archaeon]